MRFTEPFPHTVIDDYLSAETVSKINGEWPIHGKWDREDGKGSKKWSRPRLAKTAREVANAIDIGLIERATGISELFADPGLFGAGLHCIPRGGFLKMHVDFNQHPKGWHRRVNVLIYLNEAWQDEWGGHLQLGLENAKLIAPIGGRCVIFETNDESWHGHPEPLMCPPNIQRRSLAIYYYTKEPPSEPAHTTIYKKAA